MTVDERICEHCGTALESGAAFVCGPGGGQLRLPARCPSKECQEARDNAIIDDLVLRGVIDP